ncbi:AGAP000522-PA-like protein [Anopheles sinensis]|uniref:AGAP000522-PA-like protein n=1 Tax=Anopheles sinensis TaxID=74873 RepID=A0A084VEQ2_ANOSI|nr:AGAP000522-PA-like protein [Anopheles sinensis]
MEPDRNGTTCVLGLESVHVKVPIAVLVGSSVTLICECDLPDEDLYSVKWYKGKHEFFRYTSKEIPSIKIFPKAGINVGVNLSNASHLVLANVEPQSTGKYSCEITEAAPSFHTKIATRTMNVVDPPTTDPKIVDMKPYYGADEFLEVTCTSAPSLPAAKLEWFINDQPLPQPLTIPSRLEFQTLPASIDGAPGRGKPSSKRTQLDKSSQPQEQLQRPPGEQMAESVSSEPSANRYGPTGSTSGPGSEHRKPGGNNRYEASVSRLKLLLEHSHFPNGKLKPRWIMSSIQSTASGFGRRGKYDNDSHISLNRAIGSVVSDLAVTEIRKLR